MTPEEIAEFPLELIDEAIRELKQAKNALHTSNDIEVPPGEA